jgi:dihydrofolate synthase/folylpolyglutamate synthase
VNVETQKLPMSASKPSFEDALNLLESRVNLEQLQSFTPQEMGGRLDILRQLLTQLGDPETKYRTIHITGTKGKGSTCAFLDSILREEGFRVGNFTSPHLYSVTERLTINGVPCSDVEFTELVFNVAEQIDPTVLETLTYFEFITLLAFVYFAQKQVDFAIFEVGMGGRLDATNVCKPDVAIITSISFDHIAQLGPTIAEIAAEKGGIIKPGIPLVSTVRHPEARTILRSIAESQKSPSFFLEESFLTQPTVESAMPLHAFRFQTVPPFPVECDWDGLYSTMPGSHQVRNAAAAVAADLLLQHFDFEKIQTAIRKAFVPLRVEIISSSPTLPTVVFDGAHNRASIQAFCETILEKFPHRRFFLIFGISLGKDIGGILEELTGHFDRTFLTQYSTNSRHFPPQGLGTLFRNNSDSHNFDQALLNVEVVEDCYEALKRCLDAATPDDVVCVTGSMYLAAELRRAYFLHKEHQ